MEEERNKNSSREDDDKLYDRPYGWLVVLASLLCCIVVDGIAFSMGLFLSHFERDFRVHQQSAAWVGSLLAGIYLFSGPFVGVLVNKFGARKVTCAGSVIAALAFIMASQVPYFSMMIVLTGVVGGIGFGLVYLPAVVTVGKYFKKHLSRATGLAVCGSGLGQIIFPLIITPYLNDWRFCFLCMSGIILICCFLAGLVFKSNKPKPYNNLVDKLLRECDSHDKLQIQSSAITDETKHSLINDTDSVSVAVETKSSSLMGGVRISGVEEPLLVTHQQPSSELAADSASLTASPSKEDATFLDHVKELFSPDLLCNTNLILLALGGLLTSASMVTTFTFVSEYATKVGIPSEKAAYLISIIGICNVTGRVVAGLLSDCKWINAIWLNNSLVILAGISMIAWPLQTSYNWFILMVVIFGIAIATFSALRPVITIQLLGIENLNNGFGLQIMCMGIGGIIAPPLGGLLSSFAESYDYVFQVCGVVMLLSGLVTVPLTFHSRNQPDASSDITVATSEV